VGITIVPAAAETVLAMNFLLFMVYTGYKGYGNSLICFYDFRSNLDTRKIPLKLNFLYTN
jgi:hypothetical protein